MNRVLVKLLRGCAGCGVRYSVPPGASRDGRDGSSVSTKRKRRPMSRSPSVRCSRSATSSGGNRHRRHQWAADKSAGGQQGDRSGRQLAPRGADGLTVLAAGQCKATLDARHGPGSDGSRTRPAGQLVAAASQQTTTPRWRSISAAKLHGWMPVRCCRRPTKQVRASRGARKCKTSLAFRPAAASGS